MHLEGLLPTGLVIYLIFLVDFTFFRAVLIHSKTEQKLQRVPIYSLPPPRHNHPHCQPPHHSGMFVTTDGHTLTRHHHPGSTVDRGLTLDDVRSVGLDKRVMPCSFHYGGCRAVSLP